MKLMAVPRGFPKNLFTVAGCLLAALLHASPMAWAQVSADSLYKNAGEAYDRGDQVHCLPAPFWKEVLGWSIMERSAIAGD